MKRAFLIVVVGVALFAALLVASNFYHQQRMSRPYPDIEIVTDADDGAGGGDYVIGLIERNVATADDDGRLTIACEGGRLMAIMNVGNVDVIGGTMEDSFYINIDERYLPDTRPETEDGWRVAEIHAWSSPGNFESPHRTDPHQFLRRAARATVFEAGLPSGDLLRFHVAPLADHIPRLLSACPDPDAGVYDSDVY